MTQDDVIRTSPPICALDFGVPAEFAERAESYARWAIAQEREKRTGTQEFVTLPRDVVEHVRGALAYVGVGNASENPNLAQSTCRQAILKLDHALRAALEQPQVKQEQASTNTWSTADGIRCLHCHLPLSSHSEQRYCQRVEDGSQAEQPAMTPIAQRKLDSLLTEGYTISGYSIYHEQKHQHGFVTGSGLVGWWKPEGVEYPQPQGEQEPDWSDSKTLPSEVWKNPLLSLQERLQIADGAVQWNREVAENLRARLCVAQQPQVAQEPDAWMHLEGKAQPLYLHQQPKCEPLTHYEIHELFRRSWDDRQDGDEIKAFARAIERAHGITGEAK